MTIQSLIITNLFSKIIFARQFQPLPRKQIEEYAVEFFKSIHIDKDSTVIEGNKNRFLYMKSNEVYIVLVTTKDSNILEDIETLKLSQRLLSDICSSNGQITISTVLDNFYDIALGLDDLISQGIYDGSNIPYIIQCLEMDSAEEKEFKKQQEVKEKAAQEQLNIRMRELEKEKRNKVFNSVGSDTLTIGSSSIAPLSNIINDNQMTTESIDLNVNVKEENNMKIKKKGKPSKVKGMKLGGKKNEISDDKNNDDEN